MNKEDSSQKNIYDYEEEQTLITGFMTIRLIIALFPDKSLSKCIDTLSLDGGIRKDDVIIESLKEYGLNTVGTLVIILYIILLAPREISKRRKGQHKRYEDFENKLTESIEKVQHLFEIVIEIDNGKSNSKSESENIIDIIRNSIAHTNVRFLDQYFVFVDEYNVSKRAVKIKNDNIDSFLAQLNSAFTSYIEGIIKQQN